MRKSSRSISLALIGSALLLGGCGATEDESEWAATDEEVAQDGTNGTAQAVATGNDQYNQQHGGSSGGRTAARIGGALIGSQIGRSIGGGGVGGGYGPSYGGGGATASPSARGGFGSSAGASGASASS